MTLASTLLSSIYILDLPSTRLIHKHGPGQSPTSTSNPRVQTRNLSLGWFPSKSDATPPLTTPPCVSYLIGPEWAGTGVKCPIGGERRRESWPRPGRPGNLCRQVRARCRQPRSFPGWLRRTRTGSPAPTRGCDSWGPTWPGACGRLRAPGSAARARPRRGNCCTPSWAAGPRRGRGRCWWCGPGPGAWLCARGWTQDPRPARLVLRGFFACALGPSRRGPTASAEQCCAGTCPPRRWRIWPRSSPRWGWVCGPALAAAGRGRGGRGGAGGAWLWERRLELRSRSYE